MWGIGHVWELYMVFLIAYFWEWNKDMGSSLQLLLALSYIMLAFLWHESLLGWSAYTSVHCILIESFVMIVAAVVQWTCYRISGNFRYQKIFRVVSNRENYTHEIFQQQNTVTFFWIQEVHCRPQYHPRQLLQQVEKWKKPSIPQETWAIWAV